RRAERSAQSRRSPALRRSPSGSPSARTPTSGSLRPTANGSAASSPGSPRRRRPLRRRRPESRPSPAAPLQRRGPSERPSRRNDPTARTRPDADRDSKRLEDSADAGREREDRPRAGLLDRGIRSVAGRPGATGDGGPVVHLLRRSLALPASQLDGLLHLPRTVRALGDARPRGGGDRQPPARPASRRRGL